MLQINVKDKMNKLVISDDTGTRKVSVGAKIATMTLTTQEEFVCRPYELYRVFTEKQV